MITIADASSHHSFVPSINRIVLAMATPNERIASVSHILRFTLLLSIGLLYLCLRMLRARSK